jgi:hypothetical protein
MPNAFNSIVRKSIFHANNIVYNILNYNKKRIWTKMEQQIMTSFVVMEMQNATKLLPPDYISGKAFFFHSLEATLKTVVFVIYSSR